jgi:hypothetical protein
MDDSTRGDLVDALRGVIDAERNAVEQLGRSTASMAVAVDLVEGGVDVAALLEGDAAALARERVHLAIARLEEARHHLVVTVARAGLEEGITVTEFARSWGVSRQLASRLVKEARLSAPRAEFATP